MPSGNELSSSKAKKLHIKFWIFVGSFRNKSIFRLPQMALEGTLLADDPGLSGMVNGRTHYSMLHDVSLPCLLVISTVRQINCFTFGDILSLSVNSLKQLDKKLTGVDLAALRSRIERQKLKRKAAELEPTDSPAAAETEKKEPPKKRAKKRSVVVPFPRAVVRCPVTSNPEPAAAWHVVASQPAVLLSEINEARTRIGNRRIISIQDHSKLDDMLEPLLPFVHIKDLAKIVANFALTAPASQRTMDVLVNFAELQHTLACGQALSSYDLKLIFHCLSRTLKALRKDNDKPDLLAPFLQPRVHEEAPDICLPPTIRSSCVFCLNDLKKMI